MCRSLFFNKVTGLSPAATSLKKRLQQWRFPVNFAVNFRINDYLHVNSKILFLLMI